MILSEKELQDLENEAVEQIRELIGSGYVREYYLQMGARDLVEWFKAGMKKALKIDQINLPMAKIGLEGLCAKQTTIAIIFNSENNSFAIGHNTCANPQGTCPREVQGFATGEGYELCKSVCEQVGHAETNALRSAGDMAKGATLLLIGHNRICNDCAKAMKEAGIKDTYIIGDLICKGNGHE